MNPLFSIIMPAYNAEEFISLSVESVLSQPDEDFELIIIDDGSVDKTQAIIADYMQRDRRIVYREIKNSGPAAARNIGMELARGKYIMFLDCDDTMTENALSRVKEALTPQLDLLIFGFRMKNMQEGSEFINSCSERVISGQKGIIKNFGELYENNLLGGCWNKVYPAELIHRNNIIFPDYRYGEDRLFQFELLSHCRQIKVISDCLYYYNVWDKESLVKKYCPQKFEICNLIDDSIQLLQKDYSFGDETNAQIDYMYLRSVVSCETNLFSESSGLSSRERRARLKDILNSDKVREKLKKYKKHDRVMNCSVMVLKTRSVWLNTIFSKFVLYVSKKHTDTFIRAKHTNSRRDNDNA